MFYRRLTILPFSVYSLSAVVVSRIIFSHMMSLISGHTSCCVFLSRCTQTRPTAGPCHTKTLIFPKLQLEIPPRDPPSLSLSLPFPSSPLLTFSLNNPSPPPLSSSSLNNLSLTLFLQQAAPHTRWMKLVLHFFSSLLPSSSSSWSSTIPQQTHSLNCLLIVQLDNCHLSPLVLSLSHKAVKGFRKGGSLGLGGFRGKRPSGPTRWQEGPSAQLLVWIESL